MGEQTFSCVIQSDQGIETSVEPLIISNGEVRFGGARWNILAAPWVSKSSMGFDYLHSDKYSVSFQTSQIGDTSIQFLFDKITKRVTFWMRTNSRSDWVRSGLCKEVTL